VADASDSDFRPWIAASADVAVLVAFVLIGRRTHHEDAGLDGFLRVWWPFAAGLAIAWVVTRLHSRPLEFGRATAAWLVTVAVGLVLRIVVEGRELKIAFAVVTLVFVGIGMLGWRGVVRTVRARRVGASTPGE